MAVDSTLLNPSVRSATVLPSAARTAAPNDQEFRGFAPSVLGVLVVVDVTSITSTPSLTVKVQGVDPRTGKTWDIVTSAAIVATGTTVLRVRPGITPVTNVAVADVLPPVFRISCTHADADSITYSVSAYLLD